MKEKEGYMILESIKYAQHERTPKKWELKKCTFGKINLIVGKNASGKSRTLSVIRGLAALLSRQPKLGYVSGNYEVLFNNGREKIKYILKFENLKVKTEKLTVGSNVRLKRGPNGKGTIDAVKAEIDAMEFKVPENEIAAFSKRDSIQHPFMDDLLNWSESLIHFSFGTSLGRNTFVSIDKDKKERKPLDPKETDMVASVFREGMLKFGSKFEKVIKRDMKLIGYKLDEVGIEVPPGLVFKVPTPHPPIGIVVKENDLKANTSQIDISQGMFRALSLIIQITYSIMARGPSCILIDDVGEGLDYERSSNLINLLCKRAEEADVQLIMSTNDRFIMNNIPLKYWSIIQRTGSTTEIYNHTNRKKSFENFEFTGLSNFDFFSSEYFLEK